MHKPLSRYQQTPSHADGYDHGHQPGPSALYVEAKLSDYSNSPLPKTGFNHNKLGMPSNFA